MQKVLVIMMLLPLLSFAQPKEKGKAGLHSIIGAGVMAGETSTSLFFQYSGGVQFNHYFAGLGVGYDSYRFNTIPVFADWRMNFGPRRVWFVYANVGAGFATNNNREEKTEYTREYMTPGLFTDGGLGYRFPLGRAQRILFSVGHSFKRITDVYEFRSPCGITPCNGPVTTNAYRYNYNRIVIKTGWEFGK